MPCLRHLILGLATLGLASCLPESQYEDEPTLAFERFETRADGTATMTLAFTDGDGNVGLTQADTLPPFCQTCAHHYNLVGDTRNGKTRPGAFPP